MNKWIKISIATAIGVAVFFAISVGTKLFEGAEIPIQVAGALLEAIVTAFITVILLSGQSSAEEVKERNVRVFEEKTNRYNKFIDLLWHTWEDRKVTLEELNELMRVISKDIILYTNKATVDKILTSLNKISVIAGKEQTNVNEKTIIQEEVFNIINQLAKELNLGGEITPDMQKKLNDLESSILPYLNLKSYKPRFISDINEIIKESDLPLKKAYYDYWVDGDYIFIDIENSPVKIIAGPIAKSHPGLSTIIGFYVEYYQFPKFWDYRDAARGWRKDMLRGFWTNPIDFVDFNSVESVNIFIEQYNLSENNPAEILSSKIIEFYKQWVFDSKKIEEITQICTIENK